MDVKNRETQRINKENAILQKFQLHKIEDRAVKKQIQKACKKIQQAFRGVVDEDEQQCKLEKEVQIVELHLNDVYGETLSRKALSTISCKTKLMEAALKDPNFDAYFCIALVLQSARTVFIQEVSKNIDIFTEQCEHQNTSLAIKRLFKNMMETHTLRKLKITKTMKIDKIFKHLLLKNEYAV